MNVTICVIVAFAAAVNCDVKADANKQYGHAEKGYGKVKAYGDEKAYEHGEKSYAKDDHYNKDHHDKDHYGYDGEYRHGIAYNKQYMYHGKYGGQCDQDGFYYKDYYSFVICSNNNAYVQPCAPGSRNSGHDSYDYGDNYYYRDFCDVNLVDHGYGAQGHYSYGHDKNDSHDNDDYYPDPDI